MYKPELQFTVVFSLTTSSFKVSLFSSASSWLANKLSCDSSCEFMLKTEKNNGLVDRVQVDGLSGHSYSGSVPLWQNAVARSGEEAEETCAVDSWQLSGVNEPRPDVEVVLPEWIRWRSSWSSAPCFLTRSSSLQQLMRDKEFQPRRSNQVIRNAYAAQKRSLGTRQTKTQYFSLWDTPL